MNNSPILFIPSVSLGIPKDTLPSQIYSPPQKKKQQQKKTKKNNIWCLTHFFAPCRANITFWFQILVPKELKLSIKFPINQYKLSPMVESRNRQLTSHQFQREKPWKELAESLHKERKSGLLQVDSYRLKFFN